MAIPAERFYVMGRTPVTEKNRQSVQDGPAAGYAQYKLFYFQLSVCFFSLLDLRKDQSQSSKNEGSDHV